MSTENTVDINQVPPDIDPLEVGIIKNPLDEDFTHAYGGKDLTIPAGEGKQFPLYVAVHLAKHLAEKIIRAEFRKGVAKIKDEKLREAESRKSIPEYKSRIWEKMKELVETESTFFTKEDERGETGKDKFIR
jgi:hypothetical protein